MAGKDGKPDYLRYMPKNSYINVYDYKSVDDLVDHLKLVSSDKLEYEKYIWFKRKHNFTREQLGKMQLNEMISLAKESIFDSNELFFSGLIDKEKSENKLCKIARHLKNTPIEVLHEQINSKRINRPLTSEACLSPSNLNKDFT